MKILRLAMFSMVMILALCSGSVALANHDPAGEHSIVNGQVVSDETMPAFAEVLVRNTLFTPPRFEHACGATLLTSE